MHMSFQDITFYFFATVLVASALGVITARNPVHAALFLVLAAAIVGPKLVLNWPTGQNWQLQAQTNSLSSGIKTI